MANGAAESDLTTLASVSNLTPWQLFYMQKNLTNRAQQPVSNSFVNYYGNPVASLQFFSPPQ